MTLIARRSLGVNLDGFVYGGRRGGWHKGIAEPNETATRFV
jgi:hypothetical protein